MTVISVTSDDHVTILGQMLRRSERRETAIYLRDGFLWVADFVDGHGHLIDAKSWLRFNCGGISAQARRRMALESASPVADDLAERIEALHRATAAAKDGQSRKCDEESPPTRLSRQEEIHTCEFS